MSQAPVDVALAMREAAAAWGRGDLARAEALCRDVLARAPDHFGALTVMGAIAGQVRSAEEAADWMRRATQAHPKQAAGFSNLGAALQRIGRRDEALTCYDRAIALHPDFPDAHNNRGFVLCELLRFAEAIVSLDRAVALRPAYPEAHNNRGNALHGGGRYPEAIASFDRAIALRPDYVEAHYNRAVALQDSRQLQEAIDAYDRALALDPRYLRAWVNRGGALIEIKRPADALESFARALALDPTDDYLLGTWLQVRMQLAEWGNHDRHVAELITRIERGEKAAPPFSVVGLVDSLTLQRKAAETWVADRYPARIDAPPAPARGSNERIRIGYFSTDFHRHAVMNVMAGMFEQHDRARFEVVGFRLGNRPDDEMTRRVASAFDRFVDARGRPDEDVAALARSMPIDVAVDLNGHTMLARTGIFARRAAPVQATYLGYPGTSGAPYFDYLIADDVLVPPAARHGYSESIVHLPGCYQVNGRRAIADRLFTRAELGLPDDGFVFCCFNNIFKITPAVFGTWMRVLARVPGSVLWLVDDNARATDNLRREAAARGVEASRLVFAPRLPASEHLARHRAADLFLDTFPYPAHATGSDALWAGLPLLTRAGESFASRVGATLLNAVGLAELVTATDDGYESLAIGLAVDPPRLAAIRERLARNRDSSGLFDDARFCRHLEAAFVAMHERRKAGLPPADLRLAQQGMA